MPKGLPIDPTAPVGWTNVPDTDMASISVCADLITNSTAQVSNLNNNASPGKLQTNIHYQRTALWLRNDQLVAIAFHTLDGPTKVNSGQKRHPKYCVCAGIDQSLYVPTPPPLDPGDDTYQSIRNAVIAFAKDNQAVDRRIYIVIGQGNGPQPGDWIYPIYDCAIRNDAAFGEGETSAGVQEDYSKQPKPARWTANLTTWKLKKWQDA